MPCSTARRNQPDVTSEVIPTRRPSRVCRPWSAGDGIDRARGPVVCAEVSDELSDVPHRLSEAERVRRSVPSAWLPHAWRNGGDGEGTASQPRCARVQETVAAGGVAG